MYTSDFDATSAFAMDQAQLVSDVIEDVLGAPGANFGKKIRLRLFRVRSRPLAFVDWWGTEPLPDSNGRVTQWLEAWAVPNGPFDAQTVLREYYRLGGLSNRLSNAYNSPAATGLTLKTDITGRDPSKWSFGGWWFNNLFYPTHEAFRSAWNSTGFVKPTRINNTDSSWYGTDQFGDKLPFDTTPPPMSVQPKGQRFAVNKEQNYVEWGAWISFSYRHVATPDKLISQGPSPSSSASPAIPASDSLTFASELAEIPRRSASSTSWEWMRQLLIVSSC